MLGVQLAVMLDSEKKSLWIVKRKIPVVDMNRLWNSFVDVVSWSELARPHQGGSMLVLVWQSWSQFVFWQISIKVCWVFRYLGTLYLDALVPRHRAIIHLNNVQSSAHPGTSSYRPLWCWQPPDSLSAPLWRGWWGRLCPCCNQVPKCSWKLFYFSQVPKCSWKLLYFCKK